MVILAIFIMSLFEAEAFSEKDISLVPNKEITLRISNGPGKVQLIYLDPNGEEIFNRVIRVEIGEKILLKRIN